MPLTAGAHLGPYEILAAIGAGGMGEVYRARDTRLDRTVAIKILPESLAADPQFRERFDREARTISQVEHPHIRAFMTPANMRAARFSSCSTGSGNPSAIVAFAKKISPASLSNVTPSWVWAVRPLKQAPAAAYLH